MAKSREKPQANLMEKLPWIQKERYIKLMGKLPVEFLEESEGAIQFRYNPRTKEGREYFSATFKNLEKKRK